MELDRKTMRKIAGLLAFAILLYLGLKNLSVVISILSYSYGLIFPFILGGCIAFVLNIPMTLIEKRLDKLRWGLHRRGGRVISLILSCVFIFGIIGLVSYLVIPQIVTTAKVLPDTFHRFSLSLKGWAENKDFIFSDVASRINSVDINWEGLFNNVKSTIFSGASSMLSSTIGIATSFASGILNFLLALIFSIYILLQKKKLGTQFKKVLYAFLSREQADSFLNIAALTSQTFSNFITGQCLEAVILGAMFFVTMLLLQFPYAMVVSVLIACTALIPILGSFIGCFIGMFLIVMVNPMQAGLFLVVFLILQQIEGNLVYPRVVGNSVGLPSMWVLVAITIGGKTMGVVGMIIFIPLFSVAYVLFRREVYSRLRTRRVEIE